jgi:hypothetical protein
MKLLVFVAALAAYGWHSGTLGRWADDIADVAAERKTSNAARSVAAREAEVDPAGSREQAIARQDEMRAAGARYLQDEQARTERERRAGEEIVERERRRDLVHPIR